MYNLALLQQRIILVFELLTSPHADAAPGFNTLCGVGVCEIVLELFLRRVCFLALERPELSPVAKSGIWVYLGLSAPGVQGGLCKFIDTFSG